MFLSLKHVIYMLTPIVVTALLWLIFHKREKRTQRAVVFSVAMLNTLQHLLKIYIYPQYFGESFGGRSTAYNMCAFLILAAPIVLLIGSELWQNFMFYIGSIAGFFSLCVTYWLSGPVEEQIRFVICHGLLFVSSFLPFLFGIYKVNYRKCWRLPFVFYTILMILITNNMITFLLGMVGNTGDMTLFEFLKAQNPCWAMGPPANYPFVEALVSPFTPSAFLASGGGVDTPILWFAIPLFILITTVGFILGIIIDRKRFSADIKRFKNRYKKDVYFIGGKPIGKDKK